jgi:hypothetical protein
MAEILLNVELSTRQAKLLLEDCLLNVEKRHLLTIYLQIADKLAMELELKEWE